MILVEAARDAGSLVRLVRLVRLDWVSTCSRVIWLKCESDVAFLKAKVRLGTMFFFRGLFVCAWRVRWRGGCILWHIHRISAPWRGLLVCSRGRGRCMDAFRASASGKSALGPSIARYGRRGMTGLAPVCSAD